jgi:hypothetical protein
MNAWIVGVEVVGGIYSPQPPKQPLGWLLSMGAPDSPVRQPRHPTVRVRAQSTVGALSSCGIGHAERELGLHLFPKLILVVELPNTNNWTN